MKSIMIIKFNIGFPVIAAKNNMIILGHHRIYYEYKTVERRYIQEPRIKAIDKEKSPISREPTHFQFKHDFGTTSALARCTI